MSLSLSVAVDVALNPEKVLRAEHKASKQALRKAGAFVRTNARRTQLRRRKRTSAPGAPPSVHSRDKFATLKNIRFAVDAKATEVVVGPVKIMRRRAGQMQSLKTVPATLEHGGSAVVTKKRRGGGKRKRVIRIAKRPFMARAFKAELPKFKELWKGRIV